jgi:Arc/MetJ-type ribon-helix-helix transcriptional regulator
MKPLEQAYIKMMQGNAEASSDTESQDAATLNEDSLEEETISNLEDEVIDAYQSRSVGMRKAMEQMWTEAKTKADQTKGAYPGEKHDSKESPKSKEFVKDTVGDAKWDDTEEKGHDDASKAGRATKKAPRRPGDQ